jgi:hypothetical protein
MNLDDTQLIIGLNNALINITPNKWELNATSSTVPYNAVTSK